MKKTVLLTAMGVLSAFGSVAFAQESGRVISSTPVVQQVAVPHQVCSYQPVAVQQPNSGAGTVIGGLAGGALGNQIGHGDGRAAATILGVVGGALLGNRIESDSNAPRVQNVQNCTTQTSYENRTIGYNVVYEYAGRQYTAQMANDPGPSVPLQVSPMGAGAAPQMADNSAGVVMAPPVGQPQQPIGQVMAAPPPQAVYPAAYPVYPAYPAYPVYPAYYGAPYYPPVGISLGFGFSSGHFGHRHWH
ncbi:MAG TPA: glycine zipper 2TM domain-containing protein [Ramlibacter sp.]|nr:glycine zipper 2TM domain-containing protein [Ramlibacter sp.]